MEGTLALYYLLCLQRETGNQLNNYSTERSRMLCASVVKANSAVFFFIVDFAKAKEFPVLERADASDSLSNTLIGRSGEESRIEMW